MEREPEHVITIRRVLGWGWGASLAAGALTAIISRSAGAGALVAGIGASLPLFYGLGCAVLDDLAARRWFGYTRKLARQRDALTTQHIATQNKLHDLREIRPDERGRLPLLYGDNGILRDPNNLRAFT
ncbi:MAG: hypothetical protein JW934_05525, partial [Anaerolineae bacterium]|nr:hypothetical protein [Anaerolineae bacterium]